MMVGKPKIETGYDFDGSPMRRVTFDLNAPDCDEQIERFFTETSELSESISPPTKETT